MTRLILLGVLSAFFFSGTFVLNRAMSLQGGSWVWTASLRYFYMLILLAGWLVLAGRTRVLKGVVAAFCRNWCFWTVAGGIGFGVFYALLSFSASFAPGWVVATTWQSTILATPVVLLLFGKKVPRRGIFFTLLIFLGIVLVTVEQATSASLKEVLLGVLPVLGAAFAYPIGNQLLWEVRHGSNPLLPRIRDPVLDDSLGRVLIMVLGSLPFWILLILVTRPAAPSTGQLINTATVAVFSGVIATSLFFKARHLAKTPFELSAVDATQSTEVLFSLVGEIVLLHGSLPGVAGAEGIVLSVVGLALYVRSQTVGEG
ncbi:membrane protein [Geomonas silvestris]|uniref:Membrane protein n=1 Tax=Geomonas silvestris TaxID=2740184 RepID=A0A6V8MNR3_9BACT|nr:multidrug resistance efflux transporter family protein [Geomonas silvestris]GFO61353.1 membrane protein [Geomonas silvestris]